MAKQDRGLGMVEKIVMRIKERWQMGSCDLRSKLAAESIEGEKLDVCFCLECESARIDGEECQNDLRDSVDLAALKLVIRSQSEDSGRRNSWDINFAFPGFWPVSRCLV